MSTDAMVEEDPLSPLAEEFVDRRRRGERPTLEEFIARRPDLADRIRDLFPTLPTAEGLASGGASPPARLGEYRLLREVGRGGMGIVYEAVQESLGRRVALKVLPAGLACRDKFLERFRREARIAGRLHHTNIVPVHGVGEHEGSHFYAMQFIQGQSLDEVLHDVRRLRGEGSAANVAATSVRNAASSVAQGLLAGCFPGEDATPPPSTSEAGPTPARGREELVGRPGDSYYRGVARLGLQAAEALAYAHAQGVLHRDVKPSNLLIDWQGALWVTDFGLAKADGATELTAAEDLVGTLRYMPPERFRGGVDAQGDVYALGATLYEMLTLRPAFVEPDRVRLIAQIAQQSPPPPRQWAPDVPRDLETIVLKAMAREPADRYATAAALADDLRRFQEDRPILGRRASVLGRLRRWRRRNPAVAALTLSVVGLLCLLAVGSTLAAVCLAWERDKEAKVGADLEGAYQRLSKTNGQLDETNSALEGANQSLSGANTKLREVNGQLDEKNETLVTLDAEKTDKLFQSLFELARAERLGSSPGRRFASLKALHDAWLIRPAEGSLRTETIACLALTDARPALGREWKGWPAGTFALDFDGDLSRYARSDRKGVVSVRRTEDDAEVARLDVGFGAACRVELSSDGRFLAVRPEGRSGRLQVWDLSGAPERRVEETSDVVFAAFSPDARRLAVGFQEGVIEVHDLTTDRPARELRGRPGCRSAALDSEGRRAAVADGRSVYVYDLNTGGPLAEWRPPCPVEGLVWRPDGGLLAAAGEDRRLYVWDVVTHEQEVSQESLTGGGARLAFDHAGDLLASRDESGTLRLWDPRSARQLFSTPAEMQTLRFSPDDRFLGGEAEGGMVKIWEVAVAREYRTLAAEPAPRAGAEYVSYSYPQIEFSGSVAVRRDGRLLAAAASDGVRLWDLAGDGACGFLAVGPTAAVAFDGDGALLANGAAPQAGVLRWPIETDADRPEVFRLGAPVKLPLHGAGAGMDCSRKGGVTAVATGRGAQVLCPGRPDEPVALQRHDDERDDVRDVAISPDGCWVAACSHGGSGVRVWAVSDGAVPLEVPVEGAARAVFSPDGRRLAVGGKNDCRVWSVGSWQEGRRIEGAALAFTPDGAMLAVETGRGVVCLVDPETGKEYARLADPNRDRSEVCFTPDGARLAAASKEGGCIHVWDLGLIRRELADRGLDWDQPPYPPAAAPAFRLTLTGLDQLHPANKASTSLAP